MTVILETERLFLRQLLLNDVDPLAALWASADVMQYLGGPKTASQARAWVQEQQREYRERGYGYWAVIHRESAAFLGQAGVAAELGCELDPSCWGAGVAGEVLGAIRDHAFGSTGIEALRASVHPKNKAAHRLAEGIGMTVEKKEDQWLYRIERPAP